MKKKFVLTKYDGKNIGLIIYGGYATQEETKVIEDLGWEKETRVPKLPKKYIENNTDCDTFYSPKGTDIFGLHTKSEEKKHKQEIVNALAKIKIEVYYRKGNPMELI
jgi:hypothetical protein